MTVRIKTGFTEKILDAEYVEIEEVDTAEIHNGKWVFKGEVAE